MSSQRIAMREQSSTDPTGQVSYLLTDHLGSTTAMVNANGAILTGQRYSSWGQTISGGVSAAYQYTGQRNTSLGIYYYGARFYDGALGRFLTPDSIIPQPGNPQDWDRYAYVRNNPINATDPSGHRPCEGVETERTCSHGSSLRYLSFDKRYGLTFTGTGWTADLISAVRHATFLAGTAFAGGDTGITPSQAFRSQYRNGITFEWNTNDSRMRSEDQNANPACIGSFSGECAAGGGFTISGSHIVFASMSGQGSGQFARMIKNVLHELGHAYRNRHGGINPPQEFVNARAQILRPNQYDGVLDWQQNMAATPSETFADMFIAWVYGAWNTNPRNVTIVSQAQTWMSGQMP